MVTPLQPINYGSPLGVEANTSSGELLSANSRRRYAFIYNDGPQTAFLGIGVDAQANRGIVLTAGSWYEFSSQRDNLTGEAVNVITANGTATVTAQEGTK